MVAAVAVYLRDVVQVVSLGLTVWMFLSPIVYPMEMVPEKFQTLLWMNPVTLLVDGYRGIILEGRCPTLIAWMTLGSVAAISYGLGYWMFQRLKPGFSDVL